MKKLIASAMALTLMTAALTGCGTTEPEAPESIQFTAEAQVLTETGETFDAAAVLEITGDADAEITYSSSDETVVTVSDDGVVTAAGSGTATITAASSADDSIAATMDVAVYDCTGIYSGDKYIEAMGCEIAIDITLAEDGTFTYYRAPMAIAMAGGGEMPEMTDQGTYVITGAEVIFTAEELGEYTVALNITDGTISLEGNLPTGGPSTDMTLTRTAE